MEKPEHITLKWGTLKSWNIRSEKGLELMRKYIEIGSSDSGMSQRDTPEQRDIICQLIDLSSAETIYLDWDGRDVSKEEAKEYVRNYEQKKALLN